MPLAPEPAAHSALMRESGFLAQPVHPADHATTAPYPR
jgi:hypothetical protein